MDYFRNEAIVNKLSYQGSRAAVFLLAIVSLTVSSEASVRQRCEPMDPPSPVPQVPVSDFKGEAKSVIDTLIGKGYRQFGELDLVQFKNEIDSTRISFYPFLRFFGSDGTERASACWRIDGAARSVDVNQWMWVYTDANQRPTIALHEFLGASRFDDHQYQVSSLMVMLAQSPAGTFPEPEQLPVLNDLARIRVEARGGGIVGVDGGGDWAAATMRLALYQASLGYLQRAKTPEEKSRALQSMFELQNMQIEIKWRLSPSIAK